MDLQITYFNVVRLESNRCSTLYSLPPAITFVSGCCKSLYVDFRSAWFRVGSGQIWSKVVKLVSRVTWW